MKCLELWIRFCSSDVSRMRISIRSLWLKRIDRSGFCIRFFVISDSAHMVHALGALHPVMDEIPNNIFDTSWIHRK